jgi:uncharacterized membrane protein YfcA
MQTYLLICAVIFFAGFTQGLSGFGSILLALPLLATFLDIKTVIPLTALTGLTMTTVLLIQLRKYLVWRKIIPFLIGTVPGIPLGVLFLKKMDKGMVEFVLGSLLIAYSVYSLVSKRRPRETAERWGYLFGFLGGCLGGAFSASGPAVIVYASLQDWPKDRIKGSLQGMFFVIGAIVVFFYTLNGLITTAVLKYFGVSFPAILLGTFVGALSYGKISDVQYKKLMFILVGLLGAFMICRA